jgi:opacity protein-like surface antigen
MRLSVTVSLFAASLALCSALPAAAQYIGVLQSAETLDKGVVKLMAAPIMVFGKNGADDAFGLAARAGYGFTKSIDAEAKLGFFENGTYIGADVEFWLLRGKEKDQGLDGSITGGLHYLLGSDENLDTIGFDVMPQVSLHVSKDLELCGALTASFESLQDAPPGADDSFTRVHLVPGFEYRLSDSLDLVGEVGIALNDHSSTYGGAGLSFYLH